MCKNHDNFSCGSDWNEDHFGITCDELDVKMKRDKRDREM